MSFVRNFGEMVLKMERLAHARNAGVLYLEVLAGSSPIDPEITDRQVTGLPQLTRNCCQKSALVLIWRGKYETFASF